AAKKYVDVPAPGLMTKSNTKHGRVIEPLGRSGSVQLSLPGYDASPPGAATLITDCPMLEYDARKSKVAVAGFFAQPIGAVALTAIPLPDCAGTDTSRLFRFTPSLPAALTTSVPFCVAWLMARLSAASSGPAPPLSPCTPPRLMRSNVAPRLMLITSAWTSGPDAYSMP